MSEVLGQSYDHGDAELQVAIGDSVRTFDFEHIQYSAPRSRGALWGTQRVPVSRTKGRVDPEGEVAFSKSVGDDFIRFIGEKAGGIFDASMTFTIIRGSGSQEKVTDILEQVELDGVQDESQSGEEPALQTFPFKWRNGTISGVPLFGGAV
jgi:hypothetical protein